MSVKKLSLFMKSLHKKKMIIYRVEHRSNPALGPYRGTDGSWKEDFHSDETGRPNIADDNKTLKFLISKKIKYIYPSDLLSVTKKRSSNLYFGCSSVKQLKKWFNKKERKNLSRMGFIVNCYEVSEGWQFDSQVLFVKSTKNKRLSSQSLAPRTKRLQDTF